LSERRRRIRMVTVFMILIILLLAGIWLEINAGYRKISPEEMWEILKGGGTKSVRYTLLNLRLPRIFTSLLVGVGLAVSGCVIQGVSRNDMAEPGILGINAGAGLFVAAFLVLVPQSSVSLTVLLPVLAFAGSMAVAVLDYRLARTGQGISPRRLLLMGVAVSTAVSSVTTILMLRLPDSDYAFVQNWLSGSIWGANWKNVRLLFVSLLLLGLFVFYKSRTLNVLSLSYQTAVGLGAAVSRQTVVLLGAAIAMSGLCCAVGGGLSFVGLVCPHMARRLVGPNYRILVPATVLTGSVLMTYADLISRTLLSPREIPVGIVAAVIGAPYFLYLLIKT
jgi:iron complex transport system permease protein